MDDTTPSANGIDPERAERGRARYKEVYGEDAMLLPPGASAFFDLMMGHLFAEVWSRPGLDIAQRRLLVMGVLAAQGRFDTLGIQFDRTLANGELTAEQVREIVVHLVPYVGYPSSGELFRVSETAIASAQGATS